MSEDEVPQGSNQTIIFSFTSMLRERERKELVSGEEDSRIQRSQSPKGREEVVSFSVALCLIGERNATYYTSSSATNDR